MMKSLKDFNVRGKRVLIRCDFNVPLNAKKAITDDFRIVKTIPTIKYLIAQKAKIILMSHLGRPDGKIVKQFSLVPVQQRLSKYLGIPVVIAKDCIGKEVEALVNKMRERDIMLLENLRFYKQEEENDLDFAKELAKLGDIYINDAFGVSHRAHASLVSVPKFLPSGAGFLLEHEIGALSKVLINPEKPLVGIIGGVKIHTKVEPIKDFLKKVDFLLVGGKIADAILNAKGISVNRPLPEPAVMKEIQKIKLTDPRLRLPVDITAALDGVYVRNAGPAGVRGDELVLDIGPETVKIFSRVISQAKTIFWSGPLGKIEDKRFAIGSLAIARAIGESNAFSVAGGRETVAFLRKYNLDHKFSHLSTAGGAMLEYLSEGTLPALEVL